MVLMSSGDHDQAVRGMKHRGVPQAIGILAASVFLLAGTVAQGAASGDAAAQVLKLQRDMVGSVRVPSQQLLSDRG